MRACAGVVHAFGSRRLGYPVTTFARPVQAGLEAGPGGSREGSLLASWLSTTDHKISGIGSWILGASTFFFLYNIYKTWKYGERVTKDDPRGLRQLAGVGDLLPAPAAQLHQDPADPIRAARLRPALPAHPDRPHPQASPTREHPAFCVSIVAVMRLR
jgi:heme/copper-type cytochrome/quinol oxidase subunit 1